MSTEHLHEILTGNGIQWVGTALHETKRGRLKPILTGIPGPLFWRHYEHGLRSRMTDAGLTIRRLAKGQWEVVCWIRRTSEPIVAGMGFAIPDATLATDRNPF